MILIGDEAPSDIPAIHYVNRLAFERPDEAELVDRLRRCGKLFLSLVAVEDKQLLGHIAFSRVRLVPAVPC